MKTKKILIIISIIVLILCIALIIRSNKKNNILDDTTPVNKEVVNNEDKNTEVISPILAHFYCPNDSFIDAKFYNIKPDNLVDLEFSDGRKYSLHQVISASGARYSNNDESFVFWNKGNTAFIMENGVVTLDNCSTEITKKKDEVIKKPTENLTIKTKDICEKNNGVWYTDNNTCEINSFSKEVCIAKGGVFNDCASACRHNPEAEVCTMQCVLTCSFK